MYGYLLQKAGQRRYRTNDIARGLQRTLSWYLYKRRWKVTNETRIIVYLLSKELLQFFKPLIEQGVPDNFFPALISSSQSVSSESSEEGSESLEPP